MRTPHSSARTAVVAAIFLVSAGWSPSAWACDPQTDRWVSGASNYWHGTLGRADFCNNASLEGDRQRAADCAWNFTFAAFAPPPDPACARTAIETSPQGMADLTNFVNAWAVQFGTVCTPATIARFSPHWHGALGKPEYCNNAAIGPSKEKAKECAFQALVRDFRVSPNSCLRDAIANTPEGNRDLDEFVRKWEIASGSVCTPETIARFSPHWHGALGKPEYCNNATIGPDLEKAKACAFKALVDIGVAPNSCLNDAIANSPEGKRDLEEFVRKWNEASGAVCTPQTIAKFSPHWHGALGKAEYCNNAAIGPDREKAKECAFQSLIELGVSPNSCLRDKIAETPEGIADLDEFVRRWESASGTSCTPETIRKYSSYWHGALGKPEYCNNAAVGPDREEAKDCAFQALVRDLGVAPNSCLREEIANTPQGIADLDEFVRRWTEFQSRLPSGHRRGKSEVRAPGRCRVHRPRESARRLLPSSPIPARLDAHEAGISEGHDARRHFQQQVDLRRAAVLYQQSRRQRRPAAGPICAPPQNARTLPRRCANQPTPLCAAMPCWGTPWRISASPGGSRLRHSGRCVRASDCDARLDGQRGVSLALTRAYKVANTIRVGNSPERQALGWIAVSGEDDQPHRPVNVPSAEFPQYDLAVTVPVRAYNGAAAAPPITVNTRYMIAHPPPDGLAVPRVSDREVLPDPEPVLARDAEVILFIHGMDSRLEEALDLTRALHRIGAQRGNKYVVIAMDLPSSGYADNIDHLRISPLETIGTAKFRAVPLNDIQFTDFQYFDAGVRNNAPVLDFIEDYIVAFVETLNARMPGLEGQIRAVVGGSLGGNMAMRLGRRTDKAWIRTVMPWSPAAIWPSFARGINPLDHLPVAIAWLWAGGDARLVPETDVMRRLSFFYGFDWRMGVVGVVTNGKPQAEEWYRDDWPSKASHMFTARLDRHETYDARFRLWHWRLGAEQLTLQSATPGARHQSAALHAERDADVPDLRLRRHGREAVRAHARGGGEDDQHSGESHVSAQYGALHSERTPELAGKKHRRLS